MGDVNIAVARVVAIIGRPWAYIALRRNLDVAENRLHVAAVADHDVGRTRRGADWQNLQKAGSAPHVHGGSLRTHGGTKRTSIGDRDSAIVDRNRGVAALVVHPPEIIEWRGGAPIGQP